MLAVGVGVGIAMVGMAGGASTDDSVCVDPALCDAAGTLDLFEHWTAARRLPAELLGEGFRGLTAVGLGLALMLIGLVALNLATLLLARAAHRRTGFALRAALGASPRRLAAGVGRESLGLIASGVALGVALGAAGSLAMRAVWPLGDPPWHLTAGTMGAPVAIVLTLSLLVAGCFFWPVRVAWSRSLRGALPGGGQTTPGPAETMGRNALVVVEVAAALVLLVSAGLLVRPFAPGNGGGGSAADAPSTMVTQLRMPEGWTGTEAAPRRARAFEEILRRVRLVPGATDSSLATEGSWAGVGVTDEVTALCLECWIGYMPKQYTTRPARIHAVSPGFLERMGLRTRRGRTIAPGDRVGAPEVVVISNAFALHLFPNGDPIGKEIRFGGMGGRWVRVVGVVDDLRAPGLASRAQPEPAVYLSILQHPPSTVNLLVHGTADAGAVAGAVRSAVAAAGQGARLGEWTTLAHLLARQRAPLSWFAMLFGLLAALVAVVAGWGLHELIGYGVRRRTRELGVWMALGAEGSRVLRMVIADSIRVAGVGVVVGLIPLSGLARLLQLHVQGVDPWDPLMAAAVAGMLVLIVVVASYRPALRAAGVEPQVALREW